MNLVELPKFADKIKNIQKRGGIYLRGEKKALLSGKTGFAKLNLVTTDIKNGLRDAKVVFIDVPATNYESRFETIAPYLKDDQIVNFNTYGYWACLRVADILRRVGNKNVVLSESPSPIYWSWVKNGQATSFVMRKRVPLAVFPSRKSNETFNILKNIYPTYELAKNVLQTNFENFNMMIHLGIALLNIASYDRIKAKGEKFDFYRTGNTFHTGLLEEAQDKERIKVCQAYRVPYTSLIERVIRCYGSAGNTVYEVIRNCRVYQEAHWSPDFESLKKYIAFGDIPLALVPFVLLANVAGISTPVSKAIIDVFSAIFQINFWKEGLTLDKLGLTGLKPREVIKYVTEGET